MTKRPIKFSGGFAPVSADPLTNREVAQKLWDAAEVANDPHGMFKATRLAANMSMKQMADAINKWLRNGIQPDESVPEVTDKLIAKWERNVLPDLAIFDTTRLMTVYGLIAQSADHTNVLNVTTACGEWWTSARERTMRTTLEAAEHRAANPQLDPPPH